MAADLKKAKKKALMELIKHVNKKRFQDKEIDPKAEMAAAMKNKEDDDLVEEQEEKAPTKQDAETEADSDFDTYRKAYMTKSAKSKPSGSSMAVVGEGKKHFPLMMKKGGKKRG
jgi:hypothetical protein